jgi:predicted nucleic acid-binding protein
MNGKVFLDTNVVIYLYSSDEPEKKKLCEEIIKNIPDVNISTQVLNEFANTMKRKFNISYGEISNSIAELANNFIVSDVSTSTILSALRLADSLKYSYFDSLVLASSIECGCDILYTEDLHHGQIINESLKIVNPFV